MIEIQGVSKSFGAVKVLEDIDLRVEPGEFFCLLGPSGCGKTTLLRLIAGLERPDAGAIRIGGKDVTSAAPHLRGCAMVFQSYALWPHLTVGENITYGLEVRKDPKDAVRRALEDALRTYRLDGLGDRLPHQLSGGQQQRVALARAMAMGPEAVLMDEPLSNLDAALRKSLRRELLEFHRRTGNTVVYVTHDQEEALALSDRIALLMEGKVVELGEPRSLYARPARLETALFLGDMNVLRGGESRDGRVASAAEGWSLPAAPTADRAKPGRGTLCIRPEKVRLAAAEGGNRLEGTIRFAEFLGTHRTLGVDTAAGTLLARAPAESAAAAGLGPGDKVFLELPGEDCLWYPEPAA